jgi:hypothetical protein
MTKTTANQQLGSILKLSSLPVLKLSIHLPLISLNDRSMPAIKNCQHNPTVIALDFGEK